MTESILIFSKIETMAPLGSLNSVGGVATEVNAINYVSPRSWLACSHFCLGFFFFVAHLYFTKLRVTKSLVNLNETFNELGLTQKTSEKK